MGCSNLEILFDREDATYRSGELLTGKVSANFTEPEEVRGVRLTVVGESRVRWTEKRGKNSTTYTGHESYFSSEFYLLGNNSGSNITLPVGHLVCPFNVQLPPNLPSSFEHVHGRIRYTIEVTFDRPWKFDHEVKTVFRIVSLLDLNFQPEASLAIDDEVAKNLYCCCIGQGSVLARISIPLGGFVPGQTIPVTVQCENGSSADVEQVQVSLRQRLTFHATGFMSNRTKDADVVVVREAYDNPFPNKSKTPVTLQLEVPLLPASGLEDCGIIDLVYLIKVKIHFSGMHCSLSSYSPILIGTVPLSGSIGPYSFGNESTTATLPSAPLLTEPSISNSREFVNIPQSGGMSQPPAIGFSANSLRPGYGDPENLPPPSYEEAVDGSGSIKGDGGAGPITGGQNPSISLPYPVYQYEPTNGNPEAPKHEKS